MSFWRFIFLVFKGELLTGLYVVRGIIVFVVCFILSAKIGIQIMVFRRF